MSLATFKYESVSVRIKGWGREKRENTSRGGK